MFDRKGVQEAMKAKQKHRENIVLSSKPTP